MAYTKIGYQNSPSTATPMNAENLNHMDEQIYENDQRLTALEGAHVSSFNGRTGAVTPAKGDYSIDKVTPTNGATAGQIPILVNNGTEEEPDLEFAMQDIPSSGHVIQNASGTDMAQEDAMQFADSFVSDDSVNGRTIVENIKEVDPVDYASTTDEGIIVTDDGDDALIGPVSDDYVEVTADGVKTVGDILNEIATQADYSKITKDAVIIDRGSTSQTIHHLMYLDVTNNTAIFVWHTVESSDHTMSLTMSPTSSKRYDDINGNRTEYTSSKPSASHTYTLYYGNKKAIVDLQTTANRCLMADGNPISDLECDKTSAGTYALKCTVDAQGNKTYSWV